MSKASLIAHDLIALLKKDGLADELPALIEELQKEVSRNQGISVISAVSLSKKEQEQIQAHVEDRWGEHPVSYITDPSLISGMLITFKDSAIDLSGRAALASLRQELK